MLPELGRIGPIVIRSYTLALDIAVLAGLGLLAWQGQRRGGRPLDWLDGGLVALVLGLIGARAGHVALHWEYFSGHLGETYQVWRGGLSWHGALAGGLIGLALYCWALPLSLRAVTDSLAPALALGAALAYSGCLMSTCGHGREIASLADMPAPLAMELPDLYGIVAPRMASPLYGLVLGLALLGIAVLLGRMIRREGVVFWIILALLGLGNFAIGFTRGDAVPMLGTLRLDQMLDLLAASSGIIGAAIAVLPGSGPRMPLETETKPIPVKE